MVFGGFVNEWFISILWAYFPQLVVMNFLLILSDGDTMNDQFKGFC